MKTRQMLKQKRQAQAQRRNRGLVTGSIIVLAVVVALFLILQTPQPSNSSSIVNVPKQDWPQANGRSLGPSDARVVISEFADFQCPACKNFHDLVQPKIISQYVASGKVRFEYHHFIVIDGNVGGSESRQAALASECANEQGAFWDYFNTLFANQQAERSGTFSNDRLKTMAANLGLDTANFNACLDSQRHASVISSDESLRVSLNLKSTPTLLINNVLVVDPNNYTKLQAAIEAALK